MIKLLEITVIIVFLVDYSGFIETISKIIWDNSMLKRLPYKEIPIHLTNCSFCLVFWTLTILSIVLGNMSLFVMLEIVLLSFSTKHIYSLMTIMDDLCTKLIGKISNMFNL